MKLFPFHISLLALALLIGTMIGASLCLAATPNPQSVPRQLSGQQTNERHQVCPGLQIVGPMISLSDADRIMVCGTGKAPWGKPAPAETKTYINAVLQREGYHFPTFRESPTNLTVVVGPATRFSKLEIAPNIGLNASDFKSTPMEKLSTNLIDRVENWVEESLSQQGYACPEFKVTADTKTGEILVSGTRAKQYLFPPVKREKLATLSERSLERLDAFVPGQVFNPDLLALTEARASNSPMVASLYHLVQCKDGNLELKQNVVAGASRLVRVGLGLNTEVGPVFRAGWSHGQMNRQGSVLKLQTLDSLKEQSAHGNLQWYIFPNLPRLFFNFGLGLTHHLEVHAQWLDSQLTLGPGYQWEFSAGRLELNLGPSLNVTRSFEGPGIENSVYLTWGGTLNWQSHYFELEQNKPTEGNKFEVGATMGFKRSWAPLDFQKYHFKFNQYYNVGDLHPAVMVLGLRVGGATTLAEETTKLPAEYFHYLGGMANVRGFQRQSLPNEAGALTTVYAGMELRFNNLILNQVSPILLWDIAKAGQTSFTLNEGVFWSPGLGMQWASPVGPVRLTAAVGFMEGIKDRASKQNWQFYLGLGEEF